MPRPRSGTRGYHDGTRHGSGMLLPSHSVRTRGSRTAHSQPCLPLPRGDEPDPGGTVGPVALRTYRRFPSKLAARGRSGLVGSSHRQHRHRRGAPGCRQKRSRRSEARRRQEAAAHRRENFGRPLLDICRALRTLADLYEDIQVLYPVHRNPNVFRVVHKELVGHPRIVLCAPLDYPSFVSAMRLATLILTDSGGVQEEAPALGKPVLVLRTDTERPEAVAEGVARLVGTSCEGIVAEVRRLLDNPAVYAAMARGASPYGDGKAADRIVAVLRDFAESPRDRDVPPPGLLN